MNSSDFGKLFCYPLDGLSFASPLYVENVSIPGQGLHNVVYVATEHDSVYAFDADGRSSTPLWKDSFINPAAGINPIPPAVTGETQDIPNEIGITGTPVIDPSTNTIYVVAATQEVSGGTTTYVNRLHALDLSTGAEKFGGPVVINPQVPGTGVDAVNGTISFNNITENQRASLLLGRQGEVYVAFANHGDNPPYHGWVLAYNASTLHQDWAFAPPATPQSGGVWMGGDGIAADTPATCSSRPATAPSTRTRAAATTATRCSSSAPAAAGQRLLHAVQLRGPRRRRPRPRLRRRDPAARPARAVPGRGHRRRQGRHDLPRRPRQHGSRRHEQRQPDRPVD